ncbi:DUF1697 domain-containing protein [Seonamhaeicola sediminis]|nr:DUF1697 domain-containing protein [Seonamhaeicola sediminis]
MEFFNYSVNQMDTYIGLFRGVNVSGQKKMSMAKLREALSKIGLKNVQTYIQSGNIIFQFLKENNNIIALKIQKTIESHFGLEVPVLVFTPKDLKRIFDECPFKKDKKESSYFTLLYEKPNKDLVLEISNISYPNEDFFITPSCVYFCCSKGYGKAKCNNIFFEKKLKVIATTRNYKTIRKLLSLTSQLD